MKNYNVRKVYKDHAHTSVVFFFICSMLMFLLNGVQTRLFTLRPQLGDRRQLRKEGREQRRRERGDEGRHEGEDGRGGC